MKKMKSLLIILACSSAILLSGQNVPSGMTSSEWARQNQDKFKYSPPTEAVQPQNRGSSLNQMKDGFTYTYIGFFDGLDGPYYWTNPPCYTGQEAAALLFGGVPSDYAISTNSSTDPSTITFTAWMVTWGIPGWAEYAQDYKLDIGNVGYDDPGVTGSATSAYIWDNPPPPGSSINYVWRVSGGAPEVPVSNWALYLGILLMVTFVVIRFRRMV
ncbi:MAG: hypothetical protein IH598_06435 [Bacteroidales bacterium]|nr:hypothetical protein [Bacteroidales bacterium]